ncbi:hypothetical protein FXO38_24072 [Capsicum annuum]|uniref:Uncharacterized protein n=1 Tax=Capsicum annuum TaxID=4072 RepID=A0A2G2ZRY9_CAPAN|nr:hypothetical protein FXO37_28111 [Capsicum annuum]KAF3636621.1 hypothetical protein FXO38_24072 [Capsicum annuum]PHT84758.1 hypothetical protein T459_13201 [Capsicum annuum]
MGRPRKDANVTVDLQEQYEDLAAQQNDLRMVMKEKHMEMKTELDKRQAELLRIVNALKDSVDGIHLHQQNRDNASPSVPQGNGVSVATGILRSNPYQANSIRNHNLSFPRFNGENLKTWLYRIEQLFIIDKHLYTTELDLLP